MTRARDKATLAPSPTGKQTIWVPASAMQPTTTDGCAALATVEIQSYRPEIVSLDFPSNGGASNAQFSVAFPKAWDKGSLTYQVYWSSANTATNTIQVGLIAVGVSNNIYINQSYGTQSYLSDDHCGDTSKLNVSSESASITVGGSVLDDSLVYFKFFRQSGLSADTHTSPCRLHGIKLFYTTDAGNDE